MHTHLTARRARRIASLLFCGIVALAESARAGDTTVFSDGDFGAGWVTTKIVDTTPSAAATFVSTTQPGGIPFVYRNTSHTYQGGLIRVAHFDPQYTLMPGTTPICAIDFAPALIHFTGMSVGGAVEYRLALRQSGATYGGPPLNVFDTLWASYIQSGLHSEDFELFAGAGPSHPDFSCTGGAIEFGFLTGNSGGVSPITKVSGIDNWLVTVHLASATWTDSTLPASNWISTKIIDTTPSANGITMNTSQPAGGFPGAYRETTHIWSNGAISEAHLNVLALHDPAIEPVYAVDFSVDAANFSGAGTEVSAGVLQGSGYYGGPYLLMLWSSGWYNFSTSGLRSTDFVLLAGSGPPHPDFTNTGTLLQFGYITGHYPAVWETMIFGIDNWVVKAHLAPPCPGTLGNAFCTDDPSIPCPCFPSLPLGGAGRGCPNSIEPRGAMLVGTGTASIANDTVILQGTGMPNSFCMYFQGLSFQTGAPFGDGKMCVAGTIVRFPIKLNICNSSQYPASNQPSISVQGGIVTPGARVYQIWYRDSPIFCTPSTYNLTNSLSINWTL